jgi:ABC-type lipoprotein release transport system permease subunit
MLFQLAWRNIWRNHHRSLITMASIASAVMLAVVTVALQKGVFDNLVENLVGMYSGHIQVHSEGYWEEQVLDNAFLLTDSMLSGVAAVAGVEAVSPRLETFSLLSMDEKTKGALVVGILPDREDGLTGLGYKLMSGVLPEVSASSVLLGEGLAERIQAGVGDTVVLLGQGYFGSMAAGKFPVAGLLHFGSPALNDQVVYLPLPAAQHWLDAPGMATTLAVRVSAGSDLSAVAQQLGLVAREGWEVLTWEEMMPEIVQHIRTDNAGMLIMLGVLYLLIAFGIFSTLLMMLAERQREFGMLVALGMKQRAIAAVLVMESVLLTLGGCLVGVLLSLPVTWYLTVHPMRFEGEFAEIYEQFGFEAVFPAVMEPGIFLRQAVFVLALGLLLSAYPVWRVLKLDPVEAMRR